MASSEISSREKVYASKTDYRGHSNLWLQGVKLNFGTTCCSLKSITAFTPMSPFPHCSQPVTEWGWDTQADAVLGKAALLWWETALSMTQWPHWLTLQLPCSVRYYRPSFHPSFALYLESDLHCYSKVSWTLLISPHFLSQASSLINFLPIQYHLAVFVLT